MPKDVKYTIRAVDKTKTAIAGIKKGFGSLQASATRAAAGITRVFGRASQKIAAGFKRIKLPAALTGILGGAAAGAGLVKSLGASAEFETLNLRLKAVSSSAEEAKRIFKELKDFSESTPLALGDLIGGQIILQGAGLGISELRKVAEVAAVMGKSVEDFALALVSLEAEPLKKLAIDLGTNGDIRTFRFKNKAGEQFETVTDGIEEAQKELARILNLKFGGNLDEFSRTLAGRVSTLKDNIHAFFASFGDQFLNQFKVLVDQLTKAVKGLQNSKLFESISKKVSRYSDAAIGLAAGGGEGLGKVLSGAFSEMFKSILSSLVSTGGSVLMKIGAMIGQGFMSLIRSSGGALGKLLGNDKATVTDNGIVSADGKLTKFPTDETRKSEDTLKAFIDKLAEEGKKIREAMEVNTSAVKENTDSSGETDAEYRARINAMMDAVNVKAQRTERDHRRRPRAD